MHGIKVHDGRGIRKGEKKVQKVEEENRKVKRRERSEDESA